MLSTTAKRVRAGTFRSKPAGRNRYVYGYADPNNEGAALLVFDVQTDSLEAARLADSFAEKAAEAEREYQSAWQAGNRKPDKDDQQSDQHGGKERHCRRLPRSTASSAQARCDNDSARHSRPAAAGRRHARSTRDLLNILANVAEKHAAFRSLGDSWADTTSPHGRLMLTVLGGLAEFERELIRQRTGEGRARAKARGVRLGRRPKLNAHQRRVALGRKDAGEALAEIARSYNVHHSTISRLQP
jgi:hypothetical protein